jgi:hypothetical protein
MFRQVLPKKVKRLVGHSRVAVKLLRGYLPQHIVQVLLPQSPIATQNLQCGIPLRIYVAAHEKGVKQSDQRWLGFSSHTENQYWKMPIDGVTRPKCRFDSSRLLFRDKTIVGRSVPDALRIHS